MDVQNYKKLYPKAFDFYEILKMREQIFENSQTFFVIVLGCTKKDRQQLFKVKIEYRREAP